MEPISGGILGALLGGVFRMAPEILKWMDKKNEREHELSMFKEQSALEKLKGDIKLTEIGAQRNADVDSKVLDSLKASIDQQTELVKVAGAGWIASLSASVRPVITYFILVLWALIHLFLVVKTNGTAVESFKLMMSADFVALVSGTINYWFLDRTLNKRGL